MRKGEESLKDFVDRSFRETEFPTQDHITIAGIHGRMIALAYEGALKMYRGCGMTVGQLIVTAISLDKADYDNLEFEGYVSIRQIGHVSWDTNDWFISFKIADGDQMTNVRAEFMS